MAEKNYYQDNRDLLFNIDCFINWQELIAAKENDFADAKEYQKNQDEALQFAPSNTQEALDFYKEVLHQYGELAAKRLAPAAADMDKKGLHFADGKVTPPQEFIDVVDTLSQAGLIGTSVSRKYGGLFLPLVTYEILSEIVSRADASFGLTLGCYNLAEVIEKFGDEKMKEKYLSSMCEGKIIGAMALTEPDFGSDLPHVRTQAQKSANGMYILRGSKRFITHGCGVGDRPAAILTLARSGGEGARGLSFFLVESNDVEVSRIEEKMGLHCSPTCELVYDNSKALLIGEEGKGLVKYSMEMMNGARLGIAAQSVGIGEAALQEAKQYASQREQFGMLLQEIPSVKRLLQDSEAKVQAMRALVIRTSEIVDMYDSLSTMLLAAGENEKAVRRNPRVFFYDKLAKVLTPTAKLFCSEEVNKVAYDCLQVFGGYGYTEEYNASKIYRDARITSIYEGTSQLQVLAAIGGVFEVAKDNSPIKNYIAEKMQAVEQVFTFSALQEGLQTLQQLIGDFKALEKEIREANGIDMVTYFAYFFSLLLFSEQVAVARECDHAFCSAKEEMLSVFQVLAEGQMQAIDRRIKLLQKC